MKMNTEALWGLPCTQTHPGRVNLPLPFRDASFRWALLAAILTTASYVMPEGLNPQDDKKLPE